MKKSVLFFTVVFLVFSMNNDVYAQRGGSAQVVEIRLASPLPRNSDWGRGLDRLASDWARVTNNQVRLRVIHDGLEGGETKMLSSLSSNNIQAALLSTAGISEICPAVMALSVPFLIRNDQELDLVLRDVLPVLDNQVNNNYVVITWARSGWVHVFSREVIVTPDDLRRHKLGSSPELRDINTAFRNMGFQTVETDLGDIGTRIANNVINAFYLIPEAIAPLGLHRHLSNMMDLSIAPVMGAVVMNRVTWNRLTANQQRDMVASARRLAGEFEEMMTRVAANAVVSMQRDGLRVNRPTPAQEEMWRT
jgi:TRAP-type C4-dicarboxylate transport system substrate-binding protein